MRTSSTAHSTEAPLLRQRSPACHGCDHGPPNRSGRAWAPFQIEVFNVPGHKTVTPTLSVASSPAAASAMPATAYFDAA